MLRVLLTNDDGIDAEGLQALRRALLALEDVELAVDRAGRQPLRDRPLDHDPAPAVGRGGRRSSDGTVGYACDGTPVDCVRLAVARPGRRLRARPDRLRHQPRRQPRRRHHLLGHGRRGARGRRARHPRRSRSPSSRRARDGLPARRPLRLRRRRRVHRAARRPSSTTCRCPRARCSTSTCPAGEIERRRGRAARQAHLPRPARRWSRRTSGRKLYRVYGDSPVHDDEPGTDLAAVAAGRIAVTPLHFDLTAEHGHRGAAGVRPRAPARARRARSRMSRATSCASSSPTTATATTSSTTRRSATTTTTRCSTSCARSSASTPSCSRPTRRPSASAASRSAQLEKVTPPAADALARQRALGGGAARVGRADAQPPRARGDRGPGVRVRRRAEDRRAGDLAALPRRRARARRDARQRRGRRGRHPQPAHDRRRSRCASTTRRRWSRCAARSTCRCRTSPRSTSAAPRPGSRRS